MTLNSVVLLSCRSPCSDCIRALRVPDGGRWVPCHTVGPEGRPPNNDRILRHGPISLKEKYQNTQRSR